MTDQQQAGRTIIIFSPRAFSTKRMAIAAPQPGQPTWPGYMNSFSVNSTSMADLLEPDPDAFPLGGGVVFRFPINLFEDLRGHIAAPDPGDVAEDGRVVRRVAQGGADFLGEDAAGPEGKVPVDDGDLFCPLESLADELGGE